MDEIKLRKYMVKKLFILLSTLYCLVFFINSIALDYKQEYEKDYGKRVEVNLKKIGSPEERTLGLRQMEEFTRSNPGWDFSYMCEAEARIQAGNKSYPVKKVLSGAGLYDYLGLHMLKGAFLNGSQHEYGKKVAVISETLAEKLFMIKNVVGNEVKISDAAYRIVGVYKNESTPFSTLYCDGAERIYVPYESIPGYRDLTVETVFIKGSTLEEDVFRKNKVESLLKKAYVNTNNYEIEDFYDSAVFISQPLSAFIFCIGILIVILLTKYFIRHIKESAVFFRGRIREEYLLEVLKRSKLQILALFTGAALYLFSIAAVFYIIRFKGSIPYQCIPPENFFDLQFYGNLIRDALYRANEYAGYKPTQYGLQFRYELIVAYCLTALLVINFLAVGSTFKLNLILRASNSKSVTLLVVSVVSGMVSGFVLCQLCGIQPAFSGKYVTILFVYFSLRLIKLPENISLSQRNPGLQK